MDHQPHCYKRFGFATIAVLALLLLTTGIAAAKGSANWVTITGPGLTGEVTVTDPALLAAVGPNRIADYRYPLGPTIASMGSHMPYSRPHVPYSTILQREQLSAPADAGPSYEVTEYFQDDHGQVSALHFHYHPSSTGGPGYIFSVGFLENGYTDAYGQWYPVSPGAERAIQGVLINEGVSVTASASLAWVAILTIAILLGIGWLARRRTRPGLALG